MKKKYDEQIIRDMSLRFLVCCYFGRSDDLLGAVIDRAYVDMASHTLKGFGEDYKTKWKCRFYASNVIFKSINNYSNTLSSYDDWHKNTIKEIRACYSKPSLSEGQAQKWLNMTIKYLYVLKTLFANDYSRLKEAESFLNNTNPDDYLPPVDSYVLKGSNLTEYKPWSSIGKTKYKKLKREMENNGFDFYWELEKWENFSRTHPENDDKESYARYVNNQVKKGKIIPFGK